VDGPAGKVSTTIGSEKVEGWDQKALSAALAKTGWKSTPERSRINWVMAELILVIMVIYVTMVYGPIAAFLVELFPVRIRYTSMSLPYHIGNGWFGGFLPTIAFAMVAATGDIYAGLWYPVGIAVLSLVVGLMFLPETFRRAIGHRDAVSVSADGSAGTGGPVR